MNLKTKARVRRSKKVREQCKRLRKHRLCVHRTSKHIYAQIIEPVTGNICAAASTLAKAFDKSAKTGNKDAAAKVGGMIAKLAVEKGVTHVAFDRSGFKYHGRMKALADAAREGGIEF